MSKCVNENCPNDPLKSMGAVVVSVDGDMACCPECRGEYEKQKSHFLDNILPSDSAFSNWLGVDDLG